MHNNPMGTVEELRARGIDPEKNGSCARRDAIVDGVKIMGCEYHTQKMRGGGVRGCLFSQPEYGAFRDSGPQNVAVYRRLNRTADTGAAACTVHACFMAEKLWRVRMEQQEQTGEKVSIVALQGQKFICRERVARDPRPDAKDMGIIVEVHQDKDGACSCGKKACRKHIVPTFDGFKEIGPEMEFEQGLDKMAAARRRQAALGEMGADTGIS